MNFSKEQGANLSSKQPTRFLGDTITASVGSTDLCPLRTPARTAEIPRTAAVPTQPVTALTDLPQRWPDLCV